MTPNQIESIAIVIHESACLSELGARDFSDVIAELCRLSGYSDAKAEDVRQEVYYLHPNQD